MGSLLCYSPLFILPHICREMWGEGVLTQGLPGTSCELKTLQNGWISNPFESSSYHSLKHY